MLYAFGSNGSDQLGLYHKDDVNQPQPSWFQSRDIRSNIKQVAAGGNHTLVLGHNGFVEAFGDNEHNQCSIPLPSVIIDGASDNPIIQVSATWTGSTYLHADGTMATAGEGLSGERGLHEGVTTTAKACGMSYLPSGDVRVVQIASSMAHTVAVHSNGEVWGWGKGRKGQLGKPAKDVWYPRKIEGIPFPVAKAVCGKDFTCVLGAREEGRLAIIGADGRDRFGLRASAPQSVPGWKGVSASWGSVFILHEDGKLSGFGRDDHGQLPPPGLPAIEAIAAGSEHCVALTKAGSVLAWGWGEHGNCGLPTDQNGDVKGRWNEIPVDGVATAVFAGCATSFIAVDDR